MEDVSKGDGIEIDESVQGKENKDNKFNFTFTPTSYDLLNQKRENNESFGVYSSKNFFEFIPKFNGTIGMKTEEWIFKVENALKRFKINDMEVMEILLPKLQGNAFQMYMSDIKEKKVVSWSLFRDSIL